jgi:hypothetical protein
MILPPEAFFVAVKTRILCKIRGSARQGTASIAGYTQMSYTPWGMTKLECAGEAGEM